MLAVERHGPQLLQDARTGFQIIDGFKERNDVDLAQAHFLEQDHRLQDVRYRARHRNDAVRNRLRAKLAHRLRRRTENAQLFGRDFAEVLVCARKQQRARGLQLADQQLDLLRLAQRGVIIAQACGSEDLREHLLERLRVLTHIQ